MAVSNSLGFTGETAAMVSTRALKSPREYNDTATPADSVVADDNRANYHTVLREVDGMAEPMEGWPLPSPPGSSTSKTDVHELPAQSSTPSNMSPKAAVMLTQPMEERLATPSPRNPKFSRVPFLSKFFKSTPKDEYTSITGSSQQEDHPPPPPPKSFFEDESDNDAESIHIAQATQARIGTPVLVKHGSTAKVGLKEMLRSTPPTDTRPSSGPSRAKAASILGEDPTFIADTHREETFGRPKALQGEDPANDNGSTQSGPIGLGLWKEINPFAQTAGAPRSQSLQVPVQQLREVPASAPPVARKVSFPLPNPLDIRPEHRFLRQSIVSTPYPSAESKDRKRKRKGSPKGGVTKEAEGKIPVLTLVLYAHSNPYPKVKTLVVPTEQETMLGDKSEGGKPSIVATMRNDYDDEKLFKLIRSEYAGMRGSLHQLISARNVRSISLLSYHSASQLASRKAKPMQFRGDDVQEEIAEARMLNLLHKPSLGRNHHEWTQWVTTLPQNTKDSEAEKDKIALELVEGWSPGKLYLALAAVLVCSLLATLLWIFVGVGESSGELGDMTTDPYIKEGAGSRLAGAYAEVAAHAAGFHGAGGRVGSGAALGLLVLMFGWTGVGAWVLLSWLVT